MSARVPLGLAVIVGTGLAAVSCASAGPQTASAHRPAVAASSDAVVVTLPRDPTMLVFGDSWTWGRAATERDLGYAHRIGETLGWPTTVDGERASGYLRAGLEAGTYASRIRALPREPAPDLVVLQGSINDRAHDLSRFRDAVDEAWDALDAVYPDARLVVVGPAPQVLPVEPGTQRIDELLRAAAASRAVPYISPIDAEWITTANYDAFIDTSTAGNDHPSDAGHAYLAERLVEALGEVAVLDDPVVALEETPAPAPDEG
ncbi:SGNH/GDSL hydrolase family protein [Microbacterium sp. G2-8]|uniref:SGNH/GDSL hydrolase family protein n=1 Tax=Microbacterium sp. G2-8 TaxID=2842454 RepID=UPI0021AA467B|nr:SGNH/GDSL hydrolase family protein [Microbacterium sp. G2-8]